MGALKSYNENSCSFRTKVNDRSAAPTADVEDRVGEAAHPASVPRAVPEGKGITTCRVDNAANWRRLIAQFHVVLSVQGRGGRSASVAALLVVVAGGQKVTAAQRCVQSFIRSRRPSLDWAGLILGRC